MMLAKGGLMRERLIFGYILRAADRNPFATLSRKPFYAVPITVNEEHIARF